MTETIRYSNSQIALHWAVAVLVVGQYLFNEPIAQAWNAAANGLPVSFSPLILAHVGGGVLILALVIWRLVLKSQRAAPPPPDNEPALLKLAGQLAHWSLYGLLAAMSISGMAAWFGGLDAAAAAHSLLKVLLIALIGLHVLAVIFHHLILKSPILKRII
ncbi:cytochrome b [Aquamicrobium segne]|uniref:Cytochrome b n=1 Tax=Aquamicrobium segne TaxID=469547 RepID=A0ABW0GZK7_9HYPH